ncbi:DUF3606 domain-containing protein [Herminiimonas fonticola]|uniref:Uncharacterized protein DUF3606 n=1 Tax=Herminiimonas fonticola TaxID=303380 RepID=A0A4R6G5P4_9BURK|nr:uncharacterized protein DUF3606 [Herminiimonas fonticola]
MSIEASNRAPADLTHIRVDNQDELRYWADRFERTPRELENAVIRVGANTQDVERYLKLKSYCK